MRLLKTLLQITKYIFIVSVLGFLILFILLFTYSRKFNLAVPNIVNIEVFDNQNNKFLSLSNGNKQNYVGLDNISPNLINAFISIEDKKFYTHKGVDLKRIGGALLANIRTKAISEGASTITQQYARNLFLSQDKNVKRKLDEVLIAINLERNYTKDEILEGYLNSIYFDHSIYGVEDAALFYFNKHAHQLTIAESAIIASIPKGPSYYSPIKNPEKNKKRKNLIINELYKDGTITEQEAQAAIIEEPTLYGIKPQLESTNAPYFQDLILEELNKVLYLQPQTKQGLKVYTSLDINLNEKINESIAQYYPSDSEIEIAIYAMNPQNGHILSVVGGRDYEKSQFNRATKALRQPGSTIKPFLYYAALENGFTPATTFLSSQSTFYVDGISYSPRNFANLYADQDITMAYALAVSDNIYAVKTHLFLGQDKLVNTLRTCGFTSEIKENPSLALGTSEVTLAELTTGYAKFASLGQDVRPHLITKITDMNDNILYLNSGDKPKQVLNKTNCYLLNETMTNVFDNRLALNINVTGAPVASVLSQKFAAKSGSTDFDSWIVGFNKDIVLGVWSGFDDSRDIIRSSDQQYIKYIWADVIESYTKTRPNGWYTQPRDVVKIPLNPISGKVTGPKNLIKFLYFRKDNIPWFILDGNKKNNDEKKHLR